MTRSVCEVRAEAKTVRRERVLRWLAQRSAGAARDALYPHRTAEQRLIDSAKAAVLAELVDDFANGRES